MVPICLMICLTILSIGLVQIDCLHLSAEDAQLDYLVQIQKSYAAQVADLNIQLSEVHKQVTATDDLQKKIDIFQQAIEKQRQTIYDLQKQLIPSSTQPFIKCEVIEDSKKQQLSKQAEQLALQIGKLEDILKDIPPCDQVSGINRELQRMKAQLSNAQSVINNNCEQMLIQEQTVYQTNVKSDKWILGETLTMDQLQQQYVQRAMTYGNITNCPLETPFYSLRQCIKCDEQHVFDISRNICVRCHEDQSLNVTARKCQSMPKNSNYTYGENYVLLPLKLMPLPKKNLSSCPSSKPFFDGQNCVSCPQPDNYWNISASKCMSCPNLQVFDLNSRRCEAQVEDKLTKLSGTNWVTEDGDINRVLSERVRVLQINETTGLYTLCPDLKPYYDQIACVYCEDQFNIDTHKCSKSPSNLKYDPNMRQYVVPEQQKQMDPKSPNYITQRSQIVDSPIPNCNKTHPYYDQISCIYCSKAFPIFNYDTNRCIACDPIQFYNATTHKCQTRKSIYIKGNQTNLLATSTKTIADYKQQLNKVITQNPQKIPRQCKDPSQYAAISQCIQCDANKKQLFNVETLECVICDGTVDVKTRVCHERMYYVTNVDADNLIIDEIEKQRAKLEEKVKNNSRFEKCGIDKPFASDNYTQCINCTVQDPYFNYNAGKCIQCPTSMKYDLKIHKCGPFIYLTNYSENVIIEPPKTLADYEEEQEKTKASNLTEMCPVGTPFTNDGKLCFPCTKSMPLFNASSKLCTSCPHSYKFIKQENKCKKVYYLTDLSVEGLVESDNYTVPNVKTQQEKLKAANKNTYVICPIETPYGQEGGCSKCLDKLTYFNLKTRQCEKCADNTSYWPATRKCQVVKSVINLKANKTVQDDEHTIEKQQQAIQKLTKQGPIKVCPIQTPYPSESGCIKCPQDKQFYFLSTSSCQKCNNYKPENKTCPLKPLGYPNLTNYHWISSRPPDEIINQGQELSRAVGAKSCPAFYNQTTRDCINCSKNQLYNYDTSKCEQCPSGLSFDINVHRCVTPLPKGAYYTNIEESQQQNLIYGGLTKDQLQGTQKQLKNLYPDSEYCPTETPYYDKYRCIKCPDYKKLFNLRYQLCQVCLFQENYNPISHNCEDKNGTAIWREPSGQLVYPYLFG